MESRRVSVLKSAGFFAACIAVMFAATAIVGQLTAGLSLTMQPIATVGIVAFSVLGMSWAMLRREGRTLEAIGLTLGRRRVLELVQGIGIGVAMFGLIALGLWALRVIIWTPNPNANASFALSLTIYFVFAVLAEELVFRGYAFERLVDGFGIARAMFWMAFFFGLYHIVEINVSAPRVVTGQAAIWGILGPAAGGLFFGYAFLRSRGLMLPIGAHFGGNVAQWLLLTPRESNPGGPWLPRPVAGTLDPWLPRAAYLLALVVGAVAVHAVTRGRRYQSPVASPP